MPLPSDLFSVEFVGPLEEIDPLNDNIDVHIRMADGRIYSLLVATPNNIYWCMENEGIDYFFGCPPVFVKVLTQENVETALNALVTDEGGKWLEVYATLSV